VGGGGVRDAAVGAGGAAVIDERILAEIEHDLKYWRSMTTEVRSEWLIAHAEEILGLLERTRIPRVAWEETIEYQRMKELEADLAAARTVVEAAEKVCGKVNAVPIADHVLAVYQVTDHEESRFVTAEIEAMESALILYRSRMAESKESFQ
jgi:hypothetical protein